ncbi:MAG: indole-3-glycerol-phosphate synthase [Promethearchaeota archaeon]
MVSNKIKEIVEKRRKSLEIDKNLINSLNDINLNKNRTPLSEKIKNNLDISIISEIKPSSPTLGEIRNDIDVKKTAIEMQDAGVVGLSILTEPNYFNGSYDNLRLAVENTNLPCLMKDFVIDEIQFKIARQIGATNILLINSIVDLPKFYSLSQNYDLEPLIEIHDAEEIKDIRGLLEVGFKPKLLGVNNRNLKTLEIDLNTSRQIIPKLKEEFGEKLQVVSESGINSKDEITFVQPSGADAFLIGSSIMKSNNIKEKILELRGIK